MSEHDQTEKPKHLGSRPSERNANHPRAGIGPLICVATLGVVTLLLMNTYADSFSIRITCLISLFIGIPCHLTTFAVLKHILRPSPKHGALTITRRPLCAIALVFICPIPFVLFWLLMPSLPLEMPDSEVGSLQFCMLQIGTLSTLLNWLVVIAKTRHLSGEESAIFSGILAVLQFTVATSQPLLPEAARSFAQFISMVGSASTIITVIKLLNTLGAWPSHILKW